MTTEAESWYLFSVWIDFCVCVCVRQVEMGPFKHTVDDGLDVRKAAFECMYTLLDSCLDRLDLLIFLDHVEEGLKDHYDIRVGTQTAHYDTRGEHTPRPPLQGFSWLKIG